MNVKNIFLYLLSVMLMSPFPTTGRTKMRPFISYFPRIVKRGTSVSYMMCCLSKSNLEEKKVRFFNYD